MVYYASQDNLSDILSRIGGKTLWVPIQSDQRKHYVVNRISSIYVYSFDSEDEFIIGINSTDLESIDIVKFMSMLPAGNRVVYNAKYLAKYEFDCVDADMLIWYYTGKPIELHQDATKIFGVYSGRYRYEDDINDAIPIMRLLDYCRDVRDQFLRYDISPDSGDDGYLFYERVYRGNLVKMESSGICVDMDKHFRMFNKSIDHEILYSEYNPYTLTGRPSNGYGGINFNSINKTDGSRELIVSRFPDGRLVEMDYDSYHIRLIGNILDFKLPGDNLHDYFGRKYFNNVVITPELYDRSKKITFRQLYGGISPEYLHIPFYSAADKFINDSWDSYNQLGYFESPLSKRKFYATWFEDMTKMKMFSYIIQCVETEINMMVLDKILGYLYQVKSKLILYTYDAILIDFDPEDGNNVLKDIQSLMSSFGYPVKVKVGINYHDMISVQIN